VKKLVLACGLLLGPLLLNLVSITAQVLVHMSLIFTPVPPPVHRSIKVFKKQGWKLLQVYKTEHSKTAPFYNGSNYWLAIMLDPDNVQKTVVIYDNNSYFVYP
jgi:hypothetical protein